VEDSFRGEKEESARDSPSFAEEESSEREVSEKKVSPFLGEEASLSSRRGETDREKRVPPPFSLFPRDASIIPMGEKSVPREGTILNEGGRDLSERKKGR